MSVTAADQPPSMALRQMATAYWTSQALYVAAKLGLADYLVDGPKTAAALAQATGADEVSLYRLVRALAGIGLLDQRDDGEFSLTPTGALLRTDVPGSLRSWVTLIVSPWIWRPWGDLLHGVMTGTPAFDHAFGMDLWAYCAQNPDDGVLYDTGMADSAWPRARAAVAAYDFSGIKRVVDVGGGHGRLIATVLAAYPGMRGLLFDRPDVVVGAPDLLAGAAVADRCDIAVGDFFDAVPAGGDAYLLSQVLHDWDDERALRILRTCSAAMTSGARLLIIEQVIPAGGGVHPSKLADLHMFVMHGGRERTAAEFRELLGQAGFRVADIVPTASPWSVIVGVRT